MQQEKHPVRGVLAGVAGGLAAAWAMNAFTAGPGKQLQKAVQPEESKTSSRSSGGSGADDSAQQSGGGQGASQDATMKAADAITDAVTGGRHLTWEQQQKGGPIVHYAFGALMGGLYGGLAEYFPLVRSGFGTTFGSALFGGADLVAVPALHLSGAPSDSSPATLVTPFVAHLVYGTTTELVRRAVRKIL